MVRPEYQKVRNVHRKFQVKRFTTDSLQPEIHMAKGLSDQQIEVLRYLYDIAPHMDVHQIDILNDAYSYDLEMGKHDAVVQAANHVDEVSLSRTLKRLEGRGLIERDDTIELTELGRATVQAFLARIQ
jgi:DNA-binding MarR family transcriptional regulator